MTTSQGGLSTDAIRRGPPNTLKGGQLAPPGRGGKPRYHGHWAANPQAGVG